MRPRKPPKYRAVRTEYRGRTYASKAEAKRAYALDQLVRAGLVRQWAPQPRFQLGCPENVYVADFDVIGADGRRWVEDVKGYETRDFKRNKRLWKAYGPCPLHVIGRDREEVIPGGKQEG